MSDLKHALNWKTWAPVCGDTIRGVIARDTSRTTCKACQDGVDAEWRRLGQEPKNVWTVTVK